MKRMIIKTIITVLCLTLAACSSTAPAPSQTATPSQTSTPTPVVSEDPNWKLVWNDEFDGANNSAPDLIKWSFDLGTGEAYGMTGWGNNELEYYTDSIKNAYIEDGKLNIKALKEETNGFDYTSAKLITRDKADWLYGKVEIKAKMPIGQGIWPAFWMMPSESKYGGWPESGEIDIMEYLGHEPNIVHGTIHYGNPWKYYGEPYTLEGANFSDDYHIFALEWDPGVLRWYVDGKLYMTQRDWYTTNAEYPAPFDQKFFLQLNLAVGGNWPGNPDETTIFPQTLAIDYVRVFQRTGELPALQPKPTPAPTPTPRPVDESGNLLYNGDFSNGSEFWELGDYEAGKSALSVEDGVATVNIESGGNQFYSCQLIQKPIFIEKGATYQVSFDAWSEEERNMTVSVGMSQSPWETYSGQQSIDLTAEKKTYTFEFTLGFESDSMARIDINMGLSSKDVYLDNFIITKK